MMVELENGLRFITNFRYNVKESVAPSLTDMTFEQMDMLKSGEQKLFDSICDQTMVGSVLLMDNAKDDMKNFRAQCFYGHQRMKYNIESTEMVDHGDKN